MAEPAPGRDDVLRLLAPNPGPMTLDGTNTYLVGRDPAYVIDPGPDDEAHLDRIREAGEERGGIAGVLVTHSHADHTAAVERLAAPLLWGQVSAGFEASWQPPLPPPQEPPERIGDLRLLATPGHAVDHVAYVLDSVCFCGDLILGRGSSIVPPRAFGGSIRDYMASLERVAGLEADLLCPGHGEWIEDPPATIAEYAEHRRDRERRLVAALDAGERSRRALLAAVWSDVPEPMLPAAAVAMQAHIEKLVEEGRLEGDLDE